MSGMQINSSEGKTSKMALAKPVGLKVIDVLPVSFINTNIFFFFFFFFFHIFDQQK